MILKKKRVTILGGGPAALTCAYQLTKTPELAARHEVTVYQMGWRLGGKGASGRNRALGDRIEEHGLHILFGFYQNFFEMMRDVYTLIARPSSAPLATFREAFHPHSFGVVEASEQDVWNSWFIQFPRNCEVPGIGVTINSGLDYLSMALQSAIGAVFGWQRLANIQPCFFPEGESWERSKAQGSSNAHLGVRAAFVVLQWSLGIVSDALQVVMRELPALSNALSRARASLIAFMLENSEGRPDLHRLVLLLDFVLSSAIGILVDRVFTPAGCDGIDDIDFRDWLAQHGAAQETLASPFARAIYDAAFSFKRGAALQESMAAGVAIRTMARMGATYKGAMYYKMQAGMGDTVFGPLYLALRARGVRFAFFHKVSALHVEATAHTSKAWTWNNRWICCAAIPSATSPCTTCSASNVGPARRSASKFATTMPSRTSISSPTIRATAASACNASKRARTSTSWSTRCPCKRCRSSRLR